jgi:hypothetical protein
VQQSVTRPGKEVGKVVGYDRVGRSPTEKGLGIVIRPGMNI